MLEKMQARTGKARCRWCYTFLAAATFVAGMASAQGFDPEDLAAQVEAEMSDEARFLEMLQNSNPTRARLAMEGMLTSGDPSATRLALAFGLNSADPVLQRLALEGFFATGPSLQVTFDASALEDLRGFTNDIRKLGGSIDGEQQGFAVMTVGGYDEGQNCYVWLGSNDCGIQLTDAGVSIFFRGYWYAMELGEDGMLRGVSNMYYTKTPVPFVIPVAL